MELIKDCVKFAASLLIVMAAFELFKNNNFELLIPKGRMRFFDETMEIKNNPNFQSIYVCNRILPQQIDFTDMDTM